MKIIAFKLFTTANPAIVGRLLNEYPGGYEVKPFNYNDNKPIIVLKTVIAESKIKEIEVSDVKED